MSFPMVVQGSEGLQWEHTEGNMRPLGTKMVFPDGREYVYCQAGGTTLEPGKTMQQAVVATDHDHELAPAAADIDATSITLQLVTTAVTANMYDEGYLFANDVDGEGYLYKIVSHAVAGSTDTCAFVIQGGLRVAYTTSTRVGLRKHPCDGVIRAPITESGCLVGVTVRAITDSWYGWLQKKGPCVVLGNGDLKVGCLVARGTTTEGSVDTLCGDGTSTNIGECMADSDESGDYSLINLNIR